MGGAKVETESLGNAFHKIFSNWEKRNEVIAGRESGVKSISAPPRWTHIKSRKEKIENVAMRNEICGVTARRTRAARPVWLRG